MAPSEQEETRTTLSEQPAQRTCSKCNLTVPATVDICPNDGTRLAAPAPADGSLLVGKYQFLGVIGEGGMSVVYKARHPDLHKTVAVKMLHSHMMGANVAGRFQQEARAASTIDHRNVIRVHDYGSTADGQPYIVMDYLEGEDLGRRIRRTGPLPVLDGIQLFEQVCDGLSHAHKKGIVHRDLKPSNVVLCKDADGNLEAKLVDFGIAKVAIDGDVPGPGGALTRTGEVIGSPPYMSPEQCTGSPLDARSDIYSFGCLMFETLTGELPFAGENFMQTIFKHMQDSPPTLRSAYPQGNFPPRLEALIARCLAKPRADRFQTIDELKAELAEVRADIHDPSRGRTKRIVKISIATVCGVALIGAGIWVGSHFAQEKKPVVRRASLEDTSGLLDVGYVRQTILSSMRDDTELRLTSRTVIDQFMPAVAQLPKLKKLVLDGSAVTDEGIKALANSKAKIKHLDLDHLDISDKSIPYIKHFPLEYLNVQSTGVSDAGLKEIAEISTLENLQIARISCTPEGLAALAALPRLREIDLTRIPEFTDQWLKPIGKLTHLTKLDLEADAVSGPGLGYLRDLKNLEIFTARSVQFDGGLKYLPPLPKLAQVSLVNTSLSQEDFEALAKLPALKSLNVEGTGVSDSVIVPLAKSKSLRFLDLSKTNVTASGIKKLKALKTLESIKIVDDTGIDPSDLSSLQMYMQPINLITESQSDED